LGKATRKRENVLSFLTKGRRCCLQLVQQTFLLGVRAGLPEAGKVSVDRGRSCHELGLILFLQLQMEFRWRAPGQASLDFHIERDAGYQAHVHHTMLINILRARGEPIKRHKAYAYNNRDCDEGQAHDREHFGGDADSPAHCAAT
jgi:hypothetical protein